MTNKILRLIFGIKEVFSFINFNILPKEEEIAKIVNYLNPNKTYTSEIKPIMLKLGG